MSRSGKLLFCFTEVCLINDFVPQLGSLFTSLYGVLSQLLRIAN